MSPDRRPATRRRVRGSAAGSARHRDAPHPGDGEIVDIRQAIRRLEPPFDDLFSAAAPATGEAPARLCHDPAAPLELSTWSAHETRRLLATLIRQRLAYGRPGDGASSSAGRPADTVCAAIAQWLGREDTVVTPADALSWHAALYENDTPRRSAPAVVEAGPTAAIEAAMAARSVVPPDLLVAIVGDADKLPFGLSDAAALASDGELPVLFVAIRETDAFDGALSAVPSSAVGRLMSTYGFEVAHIDGNDVIAGSEAAGELIHTIRCARGPAYLQATCRSWRDGVDPIRRLRDAMVARGDIDAATADALTSKIGWRPARNGG